MNQNEIMNQNIEKKQLVIFTIVAYGITFLMGFFMKLGSDRGMDLSVFPNAQMMYPAAGVMLAYFITKKGGKLLPKGFYITFLIITGIMIALAAGSVFVPMEISLVEAKVSLWALVVQYVMVLGSIAAWIALLAARKEKRKAFGLGLQNGKASVFCVALFLVLYTARNVVSLAIEGELDALASVFSQTQTWVNIVMLSVNFFLVFIAFFGEEYGWRYYLQPVLQKKFGLRKGVLLLGVVWGLWHVPLDFWYYSDTGLPMAAAQQITCITVGIFFAYAYMKTDNIWVPVILHYLNNNLVPVFSGNYSADVLENQTVHWADLPLALLINGVCFGLFLLSKEFKKKDNA